MVILPLEMMVVNGTVTNLYPCFQALMTAVQYGHIAVVRLLLEHKADVTRRASDGSTAAELAMTGGHTKVRGGV
jgi:ankyrin repeat protein